MAPDSTVAFAKVSARMKLAFRKGAWILSPNFTDSFQTGPPVYPYLAHPCSSFLLGITPLFPPKTSILQLCWEISVGGSYTTVAATPRWQHMNVALLRTRLWWRSLWLDSQIADGRMRSMACLHVLNSEWVGRSGLWMIHLYPRKYMSSFPSRYTTLCR